jgi:hypothetical protein
VKVQRLSDFLDRYNEAFYWAIQVMIGNTSIRQDNTATFVFTNVMLLVGIAVFSSIIGGASALLSNLDSLAAAKKAQVDSINHYLAFRKVPTELRRKISSYVKYLWHSGLSSYHKELFEDLPDALMLQLNISLKQVICRSHACSSHTRFPRVLLTPSPTCPRVYAFLTRARVSAAKLPGTHLSCSNVPEVHTTHCACCDTPARAHDNAARGRRH